MAASQIAIALCLTLSSCGSARVAAAQRNVGPAPTVAPAVVHVADFELDTRQMKTENSPLPLPPPPLPPGPLRGIAPKPLGTTQEPAARARELVDLMATSLVAELTKAGVPARRLGATAPRPTSGWLVRGVFTQVDAGDRLRRAVIGFGAGQTRMQLAVAVDDLAHGVPKPFYEVDMAADSGKAPGAGPMIVFSPAVAAARFALAGGDQERSVRQAAVKIAADVAARVRK
jgi:hypothetical protein